MDVTSGGSINLRAQMTVAAKSVSRQLLRAQADDAFLAWIALLRAHAHAARVLSGELDRQHGLTIADYEALLHLAVADGQRLRRVDLVERLLLTPSGVTRLLQGLEEAGLVEKGVCTEDGRVTYAVLTDKGRMRLDEASCAHLKAVKALFDGQYSPAELVVFRELLERLEGDDGDCPSACP
jgi:DNA-binding MarR family transcriptional regulator